MRLKKGDHILVTRTGYSHHGVYIGNDRVIHFDGWFKNKRSA